MARPKVVVLTPAVPYDAVPHAGGRYVRDLVGVARGIGDLVVLAPDSPANREAFAHSGVPAEALIVGTAGRARPLRACAALTARLDRGLRHRDPGLPSLSFLLGLVSSRPARAALRSADVVDLQWSECARLVRAVRWLAPRARIVATFHDVQSQLFRRERAATPDEARFWAAAARRTARAERRTVRALDGLAAFSEKDLVLLGCPPHGRLVRPPLGERSRPRGPARHAAVVAFVAHLARPENDDAACWLVDRIWPSVHAAHPGAALRLVGAGASRRLREAVARTPSVTLTGYVADLESVYAATDVVAVPVRAGAGVKFKTVEALVRGIPVVATSVGAEGAAPTSCFAGLADDADAFAAALRDVLAGSERHLERAAAAREWALTAYSPHEYAIALRELYGADGPASGPERRCVRERR